MRRARCTALLLAAVGLATACGGGPGAAEDEARNLLFVVLDTTRADRLSAYGHEVATTPTVDALAAAGARFAAARSASSLTPVSAGTFLTGLLPVHHGVRSLFIQRRQTLSAEVRTLAERLAASGRRTAGFVGAAPMGSRYGFDRGFEVYSDAVAAHAERIKALGIGNAYQRRADEVTDEALAWLDGLAADGATEPFGLLVHWFDAHDPSLVPPRAFLEGRVAFDLPADLDERGHLADLFDGADAAGVGPRADDLRALYDAELAWMDAQLARLLARLDALGVRDETLVVVLADHGESLGDHGYWTHGLVWDEQLRVPLVLAGPGVPAGAVVDEPVGLVDLVPTLAELLGLGVAEGLDGRSLAPLLGGDAALLGAPRAVISEVHNAPEDRTGRPERLFAVTLFPWKLVVEPGRPPRLFDLASDPGETTDLYTEGDRVATALEARLAASGALEATDLPDLADLTDEERAMFEGLGYL